MRSRIPCVRVSQGVDSQVMTDSDVKLVAVHQAQGELEAQMIKGMLDSEGIDCMLSGESLRLTFGLTIDGLAVVQIMVRSEDEQRARDVLSGMSEE